jgi:starch phosphorylase
MPKSFDTYRVRATLPGELAVLNELAYNLYWTWTPEAIDLFRRLDRDLWNQTNHNPVKMLGTIKQDRLSEVVSDEGFMAQLQRVYEDFREYMGARTWFEGKYQKFDTPKIAYFSMEYGLTECMPIYSGGLGILAGDHLKSSSELGLPLAGVGLLYQQGYFQQYLSADGWQQETFPDNDFYNLPIQPELGEDGSPILAEVQFPGRMVYCRIWRAQVGRIPLYLLDTNTIENEYRDRKITYQLYGGDQENRIQQEVILGVGGMLALRKLDIHVHVCHMNEGHAAFMAIERARHRKENDNLTTDEAFEVVRGGTIFTTHTPVPAGIDIFSPDLIDKYFSRFYEGPKISKQKFMAMARRNPNNEQEQFNMALLALRTTAFANGVSRLHGEVSRKMWQSNWPNVPIDEVPIEHITNGVHTRSWISNEMSDLFIRYIGPDWLNKPADQSVWNRVERIPDVELWRAHERRRERMVAFTRMRLAYQLKRRGASAKEIDAAAETLNPEALTIGFARRFATYKRATLILRDIDRLKKLLHNHKRPIQFIFAGKAHPRDNEGKDLIKQLIHFIRQEDIRKHFVFLENYDINVGRYLVEGVDVWLNNPRRPMEASGTSGMKIIFNGGLNLSVLDGWWCEGYDTEIGWAIGAGEDYDDPNYQDEVESKALYDVLENDIVPLFYDRGSDDLPRGWISMMKKSMERLGPVFNTNRMAREYTEKFYMKAYENWKNLSGDDFRKARNLVAWKQLIRNYWDKVRITYAKMEKNNCDVGTALKVTAEVDLGPLKDEDVVVQIYSGPLDADFNINHGITENMKFAEKLDNDIFRYEGWIPCDESGMFGYSVRIMPFHPDLSDNFDLEMMKWIEEVVGRKIEKKVVITPKSAIGG